MQCEKCKNKIIDEYIFCPKCGNRIKITTKNILKRERHWFTTFWLNSLVIFYLSLITFLLFSLPLYIYEQENMIIFLIISTIIISTVRIIGIILLFHWRQKGFGIYIFCIAISFLLYALTNSLPFFLSVIEIVIGINIFWKILNIRKNNITTWEQLE